MINVYIQFKSKNESYYSNRSGIYKILKSSNDSAVLQGYSNDEEVILLADGVRLEGTQIKWKYAVKFHDVKQAIRQLEHPQSTQTQNIHKGRRR